MIVYHGSNHNFKNLRISKSLVNYESTLDNEGTGIYFSADLNIAKTYGKYVYSLEINNEYLLDFRSKTVCDKYLKGMLASMQKQMLNGEHIWHYIDYEQILKHMWSGGIQIFNISGEMQLQLENNYEFYSTNSDYRRATIYRAAKQYEKEKLKVYMFRHTIQNIGVIKDTSQNIVRIVDKLQSYLL